MTTQQLRSFEKRFQKAYGRKIGKTSLQYLEDGALAVVFKKDRLANKKKAKTMWGYDKVDELTKSVCKSRAAYMRKQIASGKWTGRKLRFAKHHLHTILREIDLFI